MSSASKRRDTDVMKLMMSRYKVTLADGGTNPHDFFVKFHGPKDSAYHGGIWKIHVILPQEYPYKSPSIGFCNKIFHPNIDEPSGSVCLDVINQTWSPMYDLVNVFSVFLPQLLLYPNPTDPLNPHAAMVMLKDKEQYDKTIKEYVKKFAGVDFAMDDDEDEDEEDEQQVAISSSPSLCSQTHSHSASQSSSSVTSSPTSTCLSLSSDSDFESRDSKDSGSDDMEVIEELELDFGATAEDDDGQLSDVDEMPEDEHANHHHHGVAL